MEYTTLGHSGIEISKLCLGGMSFGEASPNFHQWTIGPDETQAVIKRALDAGITSSTPPTATASAQAKSISERLYANWASPAKTSCLQARCTSTKVAFLLRPSSTK